MKNTRKWTLAAAALGTSAALLVGTAGVAGAAENGAPRDGGRGPLATLVADGTITKADIASVKEALSADREAAKDARQAAVQAARSAALATLVSNGTLTQAQADAIESASAERGGMRDLIADGTVTRDDLSELKTALEADRDKSKASFQAARESARTAALDELVSQGVLTQEQADAIGSALDSRPMKAGDRGPGKAGKGGMRG